LIFIDKRKADESEVPSDCKTIFVRNLPYEISEDEIGDKFKPCGDIKSIRMVYNSINQKFKGYVKNSYI
jgi:nucleolin